MHRSRQNLRSTRKNPVLAPIQENILDLFLPKESHAAYGMFCYATLADANENTLYTDLTGKFPVRSYKGNQYLFIAYVYSENAILVRPMKTREAKSFLQAFTSIYEYLISQSKKPKLHVLDNECSKNIVEFLNKQATKIQFVEPHQHRVNASERAVQTFKNRFIAGLSMVDQKFPLQLWDILIPQAQDTVSLLRRCWSNSKLSAYASLEGEFNFDKTPLAPLGTRTLLYLDPKQRNTWQTHAIDAWYTGPAMNHYRCYYYLIVSFKLI